MIRDLKSRVCWFLGCHCCLIQSRLKYLICLWNVEGHKRMNYHFNDPLTFYLVPSSGQNFNLLNPVICDRWGPSAHFCSDVGWVRPLQAVLTERAVIELSVLNSKKDWTLKSFEVYFHIKLLFQVSKKPLETWFHDGREQRTENLQQPQCTEPHRATKYYSWWVLRVGRW